MGVSFEIGKKMKWAIVGAVMMIIGWILVAIAHNEPTPGSFLGSFLMIIGGVLDVIILAMAVIQDLEEDSDL